MPWGTECATDIAAEKSVVNDFEVSRVCIISPLAETTSYVAGHSES